LTIAELCGKFRYTVGNTGRKGIAEMAGVVVQFGLIPVSCRQQVAASSKSVSFTRVTKDGHRVKQKTVDATTGEEVPSENLVRAFEAKKGKNSVVVPLDENDFASLQADSENATIQILEFVNASGIAPFEIEKTYFLTPDNGAERAYATLLKAMQRRSVMAVGKWTTGGKENIVLLTVYVEGGREGLLLQPIFYRHEVKAFPGLPETVRIADAEVALAERLISRLKVRDELDRSLYTDTFADRVKALVESKLAGQLIEKVQEAPRSPTDVTDLMRLLQESLDAQ
jgi:DNA end-binding protein Ku